MIDTGRVPSWNLNLREILRSGTRLHVIPSVASRLGQPRLVATVRAGDPELVLELDPADISECELKPGQQIELGFGHAIMHYTSVTVVRSISGGLVTVHHPQPPVKRPRRAFARGPLVWPFTLSAPGIPAAQWNSRNVSGGGALVAKPAEPKQACPFLAGAPLDVAFAVPQHCALATKAHVVRTQHTTDSWLLALQFHDLTDIDETKIQLLALRTVARRYLRVTASVPCELVLTDGAVIAGETVNLSGSGALFRPHGRMPGWRIGQGGSLSLQLDRCAIEVEKFSVARVQHRGDSDLVIGLEFVGISRDARSDLIDFVMALVRDV